MTPTEIIVADARERNLDPNAVLLAVSEMLKTERAVMLQKNNSVLLLEKIEPGFVALHLFTEDQPMTMVKSIKFFIEKIRSSDIKAVYGLADSEQIIKLLSAIGVDVRRSDLPNYNWMAMV
jgi:hypothetical protein